MKILLIGDVDGPLDEGMKNTAYHLRRTLARDHEVRVVAPRRLLRPAVLRDVLRFGPAIMHYMHGPTIRSFVLTKFLSLLRRQGSTAMSAPRPALSPRAEPLARLLKPDLVLVQSSRERERFERLGCRVELLPGGVSLEQFRPVSPEAKRALRVQHGFDPEAFMVLHVGQVTADRGVSLLGEVKRQLRAPAQVVIVGASTIPPQAGIVAGLETAGCLLRFGYMPRLEEFYQMADCYVFPGLGLSPAIEVPLTVLEAMACNLPIITSPFGGVPDLFQEQAGFFFARSPSEFVQKLEACRDLDPETVRTREQVEPFGWEGITRRLVGLYETTGK